MITRRIAKAIEERAARGGSDAQALSSFVRGLTTGALIGAAIAGSALLQRRRRQKPDMERYPEDLEE